MKPSAFVVLSLLLAACGSAGSSSETGPARSVTSTLGATVGGAGGTLYAISGAGVSVPRGALAESVDLTMDPASSPPASEEIGAPAGQTWLFGPEGQRFDAPVTVTLEVDLGALDPDETIDDVVVYTSPRAEPDYTPLETRVVDATHVAVRTSHFSFFSARHRALAPGEFVSTATTPDEAAYIGDWRENGGYVLGYLLGGAKIYANHYYENSVYGLIGNSGYGAWDHGHHCGWIELTHVRGSAHHVRSSVADSCPRWDDDFALTHGGPQDFRAQSWHESDGAVQPAVVLPSCSDFTVYANYDPVTHTFADPDGHEVPYRGWIVDPKEHLAKGEDCSSVRQGGATGFELHHGGTTWVPASSAVERFDTLPLYPSQPQVDVHVGYCGFGTRFVTKDNYAVEIKDSRRPGEHVTAFGFMHADCIAGIDDATAKVGYPAGGPPPTSAHQPPPSGVCCALCSNESKAYYAAELVGMTCPEAAAAFCGFMDRGAVVSSYVGTCPLAPL